MTGPFNSQAIRGVRKLQLGGGVQPDESRGKWPDPSAPHMTQGLGGFKDLRSPPAWFLVTEADGPARRRAAVSTSGKTDRMCELVVATRSRTLSNSSAVRVYVSRSRQSAQPGTADRRRPCAPLTYDSVSISAESSVPSLPLVRPTFLIDGATDTALASRVTRCLIRQSAPTAVTCALEIADEWLRAGTTQSSDPAPQLGAPTGNSAFWWRAPSFLLQAKRKLEVALGEAVQFEGVLSEAAVRWPPESGAMVSVTATGKIASSTELAPELVLYENLMDFTWSATSRTVTNPNAKGVVSGSVGLRIGGVAEVRGVGEWSGSYKVGLVEWTWDAAGGGATRFDARGVIATPRPRPSHR